MDHFVHNVHSRFWFFLSSLTRIKSSLALKRFKCHFGLNPLLCFRAETVKGDKAGGSDRAVALLTYTVSSENKNAHLYLTGNEADKVSVRFRLESGVTISELTLTLITAAHFKSFTVQS